MILLHLEKRYAVEKMFIVAWEYIPKEHISSVKTITGFTALVPMKALPPDFFSYHDYYFYEDGVVRYAKGVKDKATGTISIP